MSTGKRYDNDYKVQAVKLAMEIGQTKAAKELGLSKSAIGTWVRNARTGKLDMGDDAITFTKPLSASEKLAILKHPNGDIPSITTIYRILTKMGIIHKAKKKPNGITKADKNARKSDDLLRRNFLADSPFTKCIMDMTEIPVKGGKLYVSAIFDCFHLEVLGLAMDTNMRTELCIKTLRDAHNKHPELCGAIIHSDRGSQYTSNDYRAAMKRHGFIQSMNSSAIGGMPPRVKLNRYYDSLHAVA